MIQRIFNVNVNVTDMDRSIAFYQKFGFRVERTVDLNSAGLGRAFRTNSGRVRTCLMHIGEGPDMTRIDLAQWHDGPKKAPPRKPTDEPGLGRFALLVDDIQKEYERLRAEGVEFLAPPDKVETPFGDFKLCLAIDPDGTNVNLVQPPSGFVRLGQS